MLISVWPAILRPVDGSYAPFVRSLSGGQSLSGFEQVQPQMHDRWGATFSFHLGTDERILAARSLLTRLRGRANTVLLPAFDRRRAPVVVTAGAVSGTAIGAVIVDPPFFDRWPALAGGPYEFSPAATVTGSLTVLADDRLALAATGALPVAGQLVTLLGVRREIVAVESGPVLRIRPPLPTAPITAQSVVGTQVTAVLIADAALNATQVDITVSVGSAPQPGHLFSLGNRLHAIDAVTALGGSSYRLGVWPWLRAAALSGASADFVTPRCEMRLASDQEGADALRSLRLGLYGDITLRFDEAA